VVKRTALSTSKPAVQEVDIAVGFSRLSVSGYRRLRIVNLPLRPLNVLIGANGVGKSSILDVFDLLSSSAEGSLDRTVADAGGIASLLTADGKTNAMNFELQIDQEGAAPLIYQFRLSSKGIGYSIAHEFLTQHRDVARPSDVKYIDAAVPHVRYQNGRSVVEPDWDYNSQETALSQSPKSYRVAESLRHLLADDVSLIYHSLDVSSRAPVRLPQTLSPARTPGSNGEDLLSCLYTMRETASERFETIVDALRTAFPAFDRLEFPPQYGGLLTLGWRDRDFTRPIYANELSEGTLRFLWLATLLQSPGLPKVTLIDEPEVSLHPEMLRLLAELMREASTRTQLVVATHSDRFVRFLRPDELVVCDRDDAGGMTVQRADELDLASWMEEYTLDQLWSMGRLGGRS
jgi:predicted ATPase